VAELLSVPQYDESFSDSDSEDSGCEGDDKQETARKKSKLITSKVAWRRQLTKWQVEEQNNEASEVAETSSLPRTPRFLPATLEKLFTGYVERPLSFERTEIRRRRYDEETLQMELIAAEHSDELPDDGELSGSGDDYQA
jgi:hypothetical protein